MIWRWTLQSETAIGERADRGIFLAFSEAQGAWSADRPPSETNPSSDDEFDPGDFPPPSRSQVQKWIEQGRVRVDGAIAKSSLKLAFGMRVEIDVPDPRPLELIPEDRPLEILYEDSHLVIVNKPPALTVHPSPTQHENTLVHALLFHIRDLSGIGGVLRPGIVHRIDKDTSGALVVTKTDTAHAALSEVFSRHAIERKYWALCYGAPAWNTKTVESLIGRHPTDRKRMSMDVKVGKKALTHFRVVERYGNFASLIEATLETGRTHQVRVHLTGEGHSLLGDPVYGKPGVNQPKWQLLPMRVRMLVGELPGQALHARVLGFDHPISHLPLRVEAALPPAYQTLLDFLREPKK